MKTLADIKEQISDDFQSTFTVIDEKTLANCLSKEEIPEIEKIIRKYIQHGELRFTKTGTFHRPYDIYYIELVG